MKSAYPNMYAMKTNEFLQLIEQERARVNRNGSHFTLVLMQLANGLKQSRQNQSDVLHAIRERLRTIDQIGHYDDEHIGLLLPQTGRDGATRIIDDLWCNENVTAGISSYRIYLYP
jgi:PleD family two-component response regulator